MFQNCDEAVSVLKDIRTYSEDLAYLSNSLLKSLTDEEFAKNNIRDDDILNRKIIDELSTSKEGIIKSVNKLRRMV